MREIQADFDRMKNLIDAANNAPEDVSGDIRSMSYEYICVAIAGRLEQNLKTVLVTYANNNSNKRIGASIARLCRHFQNPSKEKILDLIALFDPVFAEQTKVEWDEDDSIGNVLSDLIGKRIVIAHQTNNNRDVTRTKVQGYYRAYTGVITKLDAHFLK